MPSRRASTSDSPARPPTFPLTPNEIAAGMGHLRIDNAFPANSSPSGLVTMPEPRIWSPPVTYIDSEGKPLPSLPPKFNVPPPPPTLPPRTRPVHIADRPNPYDLIPSLPVPTMPTPTRWDDDERPLLNPHSHSEPPPALRPGYTPMPSTPSIPFLTPPPPPPLSPPTRRTTPPFQQHSPANRPNLSIPTRFSSPPVTSSGSNQLAPPSPSRVRASSVPASPSSSRAYDGAVQCSGVTKTGKRCTRAVKTPHPYTQATPAQDGDIEVRSLPIILVEASPYLVDWLHVSVLV